MNKQKWIVGSLIAFFALNGWGVWKALSLWEDHLKGRYPTPELSQAPREDSALHSRESLTWVWDLPVVADDVIGTSLSNPPAELDPEVAGTYSWINDRTLRFTPAEDWPVARRIHVDLDTVLTNRQGRVQAVRASHTVLGPSLTVQLSDTSIRWDRKELQLRLRFNQAVDLEELRAHLVLMDDQGNTVEPSLQSTPQPVEYLVHAPWQGMKEMRLILHEGLSSIHGSEGALEREWGYTIRPPKRFAYQGREIEQPTFGPGHVDLAFTSAPDYQSLQDGLNIEPSVPFSVGRGRWWRDNYCRISGDFKPGTKYTFTFGSGIQSNDGIPLGEPVKMEVIFPQRKPGLEFAHEGWVLNATGARQVMVNTENEGELSVKLFRVHDNNQVALAVRKAGRSSGWDRSQPDRYLSVKVWEAEIPVKESGMVPLDLSEALDERGQGVYRLQVRGRTSRTTEERLIVVSDVGLLAQRNENEMMVWAVRLRDGLPVPELKVTVWSDTRQELGSGITGVDGLVRIPLDPDPELGGPLVVLAHGEDSLGMLTLNRSLPYQGPNGQRPYIKEGNEAFVYTSRGIYRPAETVHARAVVRGAGFEVPGAFPVEWVLSNPSGQEVWRDLVTLSDVGTVSAEIPLLKEWPNGRYRLEIGLPGNEAPEWGHVTFDLESFVPPQVVVTAETPSSEEYVDTVFDVSIAARMLYGGPAAQHDGNAVITLKPEDFRSSEYPGHRFSDDRKDGFGTWTRPVGTFKTNAEGQSTVRVSIPADKQGPSAMRAVVGVSVKEFSGRVATAFVSRRVDRVPYYVGIKGETKEGRRVMVDVVGVDLDGHRISESPELEVEWYRLNWQSGYRRDANGRYTYVSNEVAVSEGKRMLTLHNGHADFVLPFTTDGQYRIAVRDPEAGTSSTCRVWVGRKGASPERADQVTLSLDKDVYQPGDTAVVRIQSPFAGRALVTLEHQSLLRQEVIELTGREGEVRIPVPDEPVANLWVRAVVIRPQPGGGAAPVIRAYGSAPLILDTSHLQDELALEVPEQVRPSSSVELVLTGTPGAEVVVAGVDEGILLLTGFETPDPASWIRALRRMLSITWDGFDDLLPELGDSPLAGDVQMGGGGVGMMGRRLNPIDAKRFTPLTWWSGTHRIPEGGELRLSMEMPEFTGEVRWMAVQVGTAGMSSVEARSTVARPVVVQQSLPLFLAPGDMTDWTVRVHNKSAKAQQVVLTPRMDGPVEMEDGAQELQLKPGEARLHRWRVKAGPGIGKAQCTVNVQVEGESWADTIELAVRPVEAFSVSSNMRVLPAGDSLKLTPSGAYLDGTLTRSVRVSALPALQLEGAVQYLLRYPYGCIEQTVSAAAPALVMPEWAAETRQGAKAIVEAGIQALWRKQRSDGSFGYWNRSEKASVSGTFLALDFLLDAKDQSVAVHEDSLKAGLEWTRRWLAGRNWDLTSPSSNHELASACLVLAKAGQLDPGWAQRLRERREDLEALSRIRAAEALVRMGYRPQGLEMLHGLTHGTGNSWDWWSHTSTDADLLRVLLMIDPRDGRIPGLVERILKQRNQAGRWAHTYENAAVLKALVAYARAYGRETEPADVVWRPEGEPETRLEPDRATALDHETTGVLVNRGSRAIYLEERLEGVPLEPPEIENVFRLERRLLRLNGKEVAPGENVSSGDMLLLVIDLSRLPQSMDYLVIDQRLPAGLEPLPASAQQKPMDRLQGTPNFKPTSPRHLEVRDDRVLVFPNRLSREAHHFVVLLRAVTPGDYRFPALFAQGMYQEDVQARSTETRLQVTP